MMVDLGEISIVMARLMLEEGFEAFTYDDVTGKTVKAPVGNLTQGYGCNLSAGWSKRLATAVLREQVLEAWEPICNESWFTKCNAARRSVLLDIAFNGGEGVILQYHHLFAAIMADDWQAASHETNTGNPKLKHRYDALAQIMLTGAIGS